MSVARKVIGDYYYEKLKNFATWMVPISERTTPTASIPPPVDPGLLAKLRSSIVSYFFSTLAGIESFVGQILGPAIQLVSSIYHSWGAQSEPQPIEEPPQCAQRPRCDEPPLPPGHFHKVGETLKVWINETKDAVQHSVFKLEELVVGCPFWIYAYVVFFALLVAYLVHETITRYRGVKWIKQHPVEEKIREGCKDLILSDTVLREVMKKLRAEIEKGLNPKTKPSSSVKCFTTYVQDLPTGKEKGKFLALDLGGTNFRVLLITLNGRQFDMQSKIYAISQETMTGTGEDLFGYIAQCLYDFMREHRVEKENLPLGFTFSFPLDQIGLSKGILQRWTKGFSCSDTVGNDVVQMLKQAIDSRGDLKIDVVAILNDTTGTLMSCAWKNHNCKIGVILGTGTNACYVEKIENVIGFNGDKSKPTVIINCEWGAFGDNGELEFISTPYDKEVDKNSKNPGYQLHEKLISGMYLGEIVRLLIVKFVKDGLLFGGNLTTELNTEGEFHTKYISSIESDKRGTFKNCRKVMENFGYTTLTDEECNSIRYICECTSRRAAHLASAGLATLINKMGHSSLTIGVDGSLYRYHPHFHDLMVEKISQLVDSNIMNFGLMLSSDGSGRGAALVVASIAYQKTTTQSTSSS